MLFKASRPTLYLDYDGVLHPDEVYRRKDGTIFIKSTNETTSLFMYAETLAQHVVNRDIQIILSTSWVKALGYKRALSKLPPTLQELVVGSSYHSSRRMEWDHYSRYQQIQQHVTRHQIPKWLALDNDVEDWPVGANHHLCACDDIKGLSNKWAELSHWLDQYAPILNASPLCEP